MSAVDHLGGQFVLARSSDERIPSSVHCPTCGTYAPPGPCINCHGPISRTVSRLKTALHL